MNEQLIAIWQQIRKYNKDFTLEIKDININGIIVNDFKIDSPNEIIDILKHYLREYEK